MGSLQAVQVRLMDSNGFLKLLDIFRAALSESSLSLAVALFTFLGGGINLHRMDSAGHTFFAGGGMLEGSRIEDIRVYGLPFVLADLNSPEQKALLLARGWNP
jgi:hypothetical protein